MHTAVRYHDFSYGHRVVGHESKCAFLHGHNGRVYFEIEGIPQPASSRAANGLDAVGRVMDFSVIKQLLCAWLEENWDHKFIAWEKDPVMRALWERAGPPSVADVLLDSIFWVPFNPTAENMAEYLVNVIAPVQLKGTGCRLISVMFEETRKCAATFHI